ncbi:MAG: sel1 repeat family protein [Desulfobacterales bacterium]|nr:sel1 repeat family protein [Desulfobacterales bacterium]
MDKKPVTDVPFLLEISVLICIFLFSGSPVLSMKLSDLPGIEFKGIKIQAAEPNPERDFDVEIVDGDTAVKKIKQSIELIYKKSPDLARIIDTIRQQGEVYIVYNPNYPTREQDFSMVRVALFLPFYFSDLPRNAKRPLPIIVSRHGIKWPMEELAAIIVHELAGHGNQYLKGMTDTVRSRELECDAWLLEEHAYQQFGLDKSTKKMIDFRKQISGYKGRSGHCTAFLNYLRKSHPDKMALYERLNPDVPELRRLLSKFISHLHKSGANKKALKAKAEFIESRLARLEESGSPKKLFSTGIYLIEGAGYKQNPDRGIRLIQKAAALNHLKAQYYLAMIYSSGKGVARDNSKAYFWVSVAAKHADPEHRESIRAKQSQLAKNLNRATRISIDKKVKKWKKGQQYDS